MLLFDNVALFDKHMICFLAMNTPYRYYPVTPAQRKWGLFVTCVGHNTTQPGAVFPSPKHPDEYYFTWKVGRTLHEWQIILIEKGRGVVEFKGGRFKVETGSLIVLPPGCWHRYKPDPKTGWTTLWIGFGGELADNMIGAAGFSCDGSVQSFNNNPIIQLFAATVSDLLANDNRSPFSAAASIPMLVAAILEAPKSNQTNDDTSTASILSAQMHITEHLSETIDFQALARKVGLTYRSFRYLFVKESGLSPLQYQLERRLARAKNLLASSDIPVKDIAKTLGFNSTWYFAHFFQKHAKTSPAVYRKQHRSPSGPGSLTTSA